MGRDVGGHADGDARRPVDDEIGDLGRQDGWLGHRFIVVGDEWNGLFFDVIQHPVGQTFHADFRVTHGRRGIAIDRPEVSLTIHQRISQGKILRHADNRIIYGRIAMRMVFTDDITDDAGGFFIRFVPVVSQLVHGKENPAMYRLEAVPNIRKGSADDDAHGIIEIGFFQFAVNADIGANIGYVFNFRHVCDYLGFENNGPRKTRQKSLIQSTGWLYSAIER